MTAIRWLTLLADLVFLGVFLNVLVAAFRTPRRAYVDSAYFFGAGTLAFTIALLTPDPPGLGNRIVTILLLAMPLLLLRVVRDFTRVSPVAYRLSQLAFLTSAVAALALQPRYSTAVTLPMIAYIVATNGYATLRFAERAHAVEGARRRRKQAVAAGTLLLAALFVVLGLRRLFPAYFEPLSVAAGVCLLGSTVGYYLGFAPPTVLRRGWQQPELVTFVARLNEATSARTFREVVRTLEAGIATAVGSARAMVLLWDEERGRLTAPGLGREVLPPDRANSSLAYRAFRAGVPVHVDDASAADPANRDVYEEFHVTALLAAPLVDRGEVIGVIVLYGDAPPLFAEDDLATLVALSAPVAAVIRNWQLNEQRRAAAAFEESLNMEREFLAAAAHELRTPLTSVLGESQLLLRRLQTSPGRARENAEHIALQANRMRQLVNDLLNVARDSSSGFVDERVPTELMAIVQDVAADYPDIRVEGTPVEAEVDGKRIRQVVRNLVDNARKYSPSGSPVDVALRREGAEVLLSVTDRGVGIPASERARIFERFVRGAAGSGAEGMGLGLYLCRRIVEEHGGRIWVESTRGRGSTFHVALPLTQEPPASEHTGQSASTSESAFSIG